MSRPNRISDMDWLEYQARLVLLLLVVVTVKVCGAWVVWLSVAFWFVWVLASATIRARRQSDNREAQ